ncbi:PRTRC system protein C [Sphingobacterium siyangense]|jgi:PRTRC genetic system protein C|uniref:PRTRC system protein C n=1 Tax=Sphingobacterium siyangense TaxID=459529 RepID=UPI002FDA5F5C
MIKTTILERIFEYKEKDNNLRLTDPNPDWTPETVMNFYANTYPMLTTAKIGAPQIKDDQLIYKMESVLGTKG